MVGNLFLVVTPCSIAVRKSGVSKTYVNEPVIFNARMSFTSVGKSVFIGLSTWYCNGQNPWRNYSNGCENNNIIILPLLVDTALI